MKKPIVWNKKVKTVGDIIKILSRVDANTEVENDFPDEDKVARFTIWQDEDTKKISIKLGDE